MRSQLHETPDAAQVVTAAHSHAPIEKPSRESEPLREAELLHRMFWSVPESAFMCRVGVRTVWRLMADPKSKFPRARRIRGRTLLARDDVLAFLHQGSSR